MAAMLMPDGMTWDRRWYSYARLTRAGQTIGEVTLSNGTWFGTIYDQPVASSTALDIQRASAR